jgi:hypothetical protein
LRALGLLLSLSAAPAALAIDTIADYEVLFQHMKSGNYEYARGGFSGGIEALLDQRALLSKQAARADSPEQTAEYAGLARYAESQAGLYLYTWLEAEVRSTLVDASKLGRETDQVLLAIMAYTNRLASFTQETMDHVRPIEDHLRSSVGGEMLLRQIGEGPGELSKLYEGAARLAKVNGNRAQVEDLFRKHPDAFKLYRGASDYLDLDEDFHQRYQIPREDSEPLQAGPTRVDADTEVSIRMFVGEFHDALANRDKAALERFIVDDSTWTVEGLIQAMDDAEQSGFGPIAEFEAYILPDGKMRSLVKEVPFIFFRNQKEVVLSGAQTLTMVEDIDGWKILEVDK